MRFNRPCLKCQQLHRDKGDYCASCRAGIERTREADPARRAYKNRLYNSEYQRLAKLVRAHAVLCHICKLGYIPGDPWTADHIVPGDLKSPLAAAHRSCNSRKGNNA